MLPWLKASAVAGAVVLGGIQLVPYGHDHSNPAVTAEAPWPDEASRALAVQACYDCHSNETTWPWYSNVAPMSWLVQHDVDEARAQVNFSAWGSGDDEDELHDAVEHGEMPPSTYTAIHRDAKLSAAERDRLEEALRAMERDRGGDDDED